MVIIEYKICIIQQLPLENTYIELSGTLNGKKRLVFHDEVLWEVFTTDLTNPKKLVWVSYTIWQNGGWIMAKNQLIKKIKRPVVQVI